MPTWNIPALLFAVALSLGMAVVGGLLTGNQLTRWFTTLRKPRFQLPLWGFVCVGLYGYLVDSVIAYRLLTVVPVLPLDMVDKSTGPFRSRFGPVFGDEAIRTRPALPSVRLPPSSSAGTSPISPPYDTVPIRLRGLSSGKRWQGASEHLARRPSSMGSASGHCRCSLPISLCHQFAPSLAWLRERYS
jgi:hypothetical protein